MKYYPFVRAAAAIRYDRAIVERVQQTGLSVVCEDGRKRSGKTRDARSNRLSNGTDGPPDIIYDRKDAGQGPNMCLFARNPAELIKKMEMIRPCKTN